MDSLDVSEAEVIALLAGCHKLPGWKVLMLSLNMTLSRLSRGALASSLTLGDWRTWFVQNISF